LGSIYFINDVEGWVVGEAGTILKTTNAGNNWNFSTSPTSTPIDDIDFTNYPIGWIVAGDAFTPGKLFITSNGGTNWSEVASISLPPGGYEIQFTSDVVGWIMSGNPTISGLQRLYRTTDGGNNWDILLSNNSDTTFLSMYFLNDSTGWISTFPAQKIFHTINRGTSWERFEAPAIFNSIYFSDSLKGWGGASTGEIYLTTDGGINWVAQNSPMDNPIKKLFFHGENYGWAVGFLGNIIHTFNGGVSFMDFNYNDDYLNNIILYQNYPNPFNPTTQIRYSVLNDGIVTLKVYDVLGREVATLVNEHQQPGSYQALWDASSVSSGIYFYQLKTKEYVDTKKMMLLK